MVLAALLVVLPAGAARPRVAVWLGGPDDTQRTELSTRLRSELAIAGFDCVELGEVGDGSSASLESAARSAGAFAAIGVVRTGSLDADVWVTDRVTGKAVLRRVHFGADSADAAAIFAIRAVELLHASLLELAEPHPSRGELRPPPEIRRWVEPETKKAPEPQRDAYVAAVVLGGPGGLPVRIAPALGFSWRPLPSWEGGIEAWGPALSTVKATEGSARIDQEAALAFARFHPLGRVALGPFGRLGVGAARLGVHGDAEAPFTSQSNQVWAGLGLLGFGLRVQTGALGLTLGLDSLWSTPKSTVRFTDRTVASAGSPTLSLQIGAGLAW